MTKPKIFKNPPKIQFCSDVDGPHVKFSEEQDLSEKLGQISVATIFKFARFNWIFGGFLKILGFVIFAHLWDVFFNQNSDLVSLSTPYSHNSGPILPGIKPTGA